MRNDPMGRVEDDIDQAVSTARSMKNDASDAVANLQTSIVKAVKEQPMMALAVVAAIGFAVGALRKL